MPTERSPYEVALGGEFPALHSRLTDYFGALPAGCVGRGRGMFDVVGTPRRWLWPVLALLARRGILFPVWERDVPFTVENRPTVGGRPAVTAVRRFQLRTGERVMTDLITIENGHLIDRIGRGAPVQASFHATVTDGGLRLRSHRVSLRFGRFSLTVPAAAAPVVELSERFDESTDRQAITLTVDAPLIGRLYEYSGTFRYSVSTGGEPL